MHFEPGRYLLNGLLGKREFLMAKGICDFLEMEDIIVETLLREESLIFSRELHGSPRYLKFLVASSFPGEVYTEVFSWCHRLRWLRQ